MHEDDQLEIIGGVPPMIPLPEKRRTFFQEECLKKSITYAEELARRFALISRLGQRVKRLCQESQAMNNAFNALCSILDKDDQEHVRSLADRLLKEATNGS